MNLTKDEKQEKRMKEVNEKLIKRLRKMIAMSERSAGNEEEAATAAKMVENLLRKHNLTLADVTQEELSSEVVKHAAKGSAGTWKWTTGRCPPWVQGLAIQVANLCETFAMYIPSTDQDAHVKRKQMNFSFVGQDVDVEASIGMFIFLVNTVNALSDKYYTTNNVKTAYDSKVQMSNFRSGCAQRINERIRDIISEREQEQITMSSSKALVIRKDKAIAEYIGYEPRYGTGSRSGRYSNSAYSAGRQAGNNVKIRKELR